MKIPAEIQPRHNAVVATMDAFCSDHLNDEYRDLCRKAAAKLARKRPSPLARGTVDVWACGITYFIGSVNFLFDKTQTPHMTAGDLCERYRVSQQSGSAKARDLRKVFKASPLDPEWYRPSKMADNPLAWIITINGLAVDVRTMPRDVQEIAFQKGLIPYVPPSEARPTSPVSASLDCGG